MSSPIRVPADELRLLSSQALEKFGLRAEDAKVAADVLVEADLLGIETHGTKRLRAYVERILRGGVNTTPTITVTEKSPALAIVDGDGALGPVVGTLALEEAMNRARAGGIAYVGCRHSNHCGALMPYGLKAVEAGYVFIGGTNASTTMPPWGGAEARIGNNPVCVAAPIEGGPHFLLDMAMSVAARGKIRAAQAAGDRIPADWAVDVQGRATTDPAAALEGFLSPMGGHKGSGLSQAIDILSGALSGAQFLSGISSWLDHPELPSNIGHFFLLLDPGRLIGKGAFSEAMTRFRNLILTTPPADPTRPVRLPGQAEQERRRQAIAHGMTLPKDLIDEIKSLAGQKS